MVDPVAYAGFFFFKGGVLQYWMQAVMPRQPRPETVAERGEGGGGGGGWTPTLLHCFLPCHFPRPEVVSSYMTNLSDKQARGKMEPRGGGVFEPPLRSRLGGSLTRLVTS